MRAFALAFGLLAAVPTRASESSAVAKALVAQARAHFEAGQFELAASEYEAVYAQRPVAGLLFNMAQCYRLAALPEKAAKNYEAFLRAEPNAANVEEVRRYLVDARAAVEKRPAEVAAVVVEAPATNFVPSPAAPAPAAAVASPLDEPIMVVVPARAGRAHRLVGGAMTLTGAALLGLAAYEFVSANAAIKAAGANESVSGLAQTNRNVAKEAQRNGWIAGVGAVALIGGGGFVLLGMTF